MQTQIYPITVPARDIQRGYRKIFDKVKKLRQPIVVMSNNTPQAAIVSLDMLKKYNQMLGDQELFALIEQIHTKNRNKNLDQVLDDLTNDVEEIRQQIYEQTFGSD